MGVKISGSKEAQKSLRELPRRVVTTMAKEWKEQLDFLAERAKANAPVDEGDLRDKIEGKVQVKGQTLIDGEITCDVSYALAMHEGDYKLGKKSAAQPHTPEGGVGRKFIERAIQYNSREVDKKLGKAQLDLLDQMEREAKH